ncbi:MAG: Sec-independent protein translocase protein TatB [Burkholderiaceae bacterium]
MIDIGISKLAMIGAVALIVIGPEKLPRLARTIGTLLGKAQRYVADVKSEVSRSIELEELKKMKATVEGAANDVQNTIHTSAKDFDKQWQDATAMDGNSGAGAAATSLSAELQTPPIPYKNPGKKWRLKQGAVPHWYKARNGVRSKALSGAARVARFRPAPGAKVSAVTRASSFG